MATKKSPAEQAKARVQTALNKFRRDTGQDPYEMLVDMACKGKDARLTKLPAWRVIVEILKTGEQKMETNISNTTHVPAVYLPEKRPVGEPARLGRELADLDEPPEASH